VIILTNRDKKKASDNNTGTTKKNTRDLKIQSDDKSIIPGITPDSKKNKLSSDKSVKTVVKKNPAVNTTTAGKELISKSGSLPETIEDDPIDPSALARGDEPMTIVEHLDELRSRLLIVLGSFFVLTCIAFYFSDQLVSFINKPFLETGNRLNVFTLAGGFIIKMKVSAAIAILIMIPLIIFHLWRFISPAIERPERFFSRLTITSAIVLFYAGVCFVFFLLPSAIKVMLSFITDSMLSTIDANDYLHFIFFMSFIMGLLCELPIAILVLTKMGLITPQFLIRKRKYAVIIIWITAAIVTPGADILSQSLVGVPLMLLYEVSIIASKIVLIRKKRKELKLRNI